MSTVPPPIRIRRTRTSPVPASIPTDSPPKGRVAIRSRPPTGPEPVEPVAKPKGPATTPRKHRPLVRVDCPRRLQSHSKEARRQGGMVICTKFWGSPFRCRELDTGWCVVWVGDEMRLEQYKPEGWMDIPCESKQEAAEMCQEAFRDWLTAPAQAGLLEHARHVLKGLNLICCCQETTSDGSRYPCHGSVLLELVNEGKE